jgi:hypothetical protein
MVDTAADEQLWEVNLHLVRDVDQYYTSRDKIFATRKRFHEASEGPDTSSIPKSSMPPPSTPHTAQGVHFSPQSLSPFWYLDSLLMCIYIFLTSAQQEPEVLHHEDDDEWYPQNQPSTAGGCSGIINLIKSRLFYIKCLHTSCFSVECWRCEMLSQQLGQESGQTANSADKNKADKRNMKRKKQRERKKEKKRMQKRLAAETRSAPPATVEAQELHYQLPEGVELHKPLDNQLGIGASLGPIKSEVDLGCTGTSESAPAAPLHE